MIISQVSRFQSEAGPIPPLKFRVNGTANYAPHSPLGPACWPFYDLVVVVEGSLARKRASQRSPRAAHGPDPPPQARSSARLRMVGAGA